MDKQELNDIKKMTEIRRVEIAFMALEVAGEGGELSEAVKKFIRARDGIAGSQATLSDIADEMGDVIISIDLLASALGINLGQSIAEKFNKTSQKYGMKTLLPTPPKEGAK